MWLAEDVRNFINSMSRRNVRIAGQVITVSGDSPETKKNGIKGGNMSKVKEVPAAAVPKKLKMPEKHVMSRQKGDPGIHPKYKEEWKDFPYNGGVGSPSPERPPNRSK